MACATLAGELTLGEVCIFIDDQPATQLTELEIAPGQFLIGKICTSNLKSANNENVLLILSYHNGVKEELSFLEDLQAWSFKGKNISIKVPLTSAN